MMFTSSRHFLFFWVTLFGLTLASCNSDDDNDAGSQNGDSETGTGVGDSSSTVDTASSIVPPSDFDTEPFDTDSFLTVEESFEGDGVIVIENYESYSDDLILQLMYTPMETGDPVTLSLDTDNVGSGTRAGKVTFSLGDGAEPVCGLLGPRFGENWTGAKTFQVWLDPDVVGRFFVFQFREASGEYWEIFHRAESAEPHTVQYPIESFQIPAWFSGGDQVMDLSNVSEFNMYVSPIDENEIPASDSVIYVDDIVLLNTK